MEILLLQKVSLKTKKRVRIVYGTLLTLLAIFVAIVVVVVETKETIFDSPLNQQTQKVMPDPFPIGVNPALKQITENPVVDSYFQTHISVSAQKPTRTSWMQKAVAKLAHLDWYQNLASPMSRILVVRSGERKEEVVDNFGDILRWDDEMRSIFDARVSDAVPELPDGKFFPEHYVVTKDATPEDVATILIERFNNEVMSRYSNEVASLVPIEDALVIASLLEREAYDFEDMRHIAGVIWNRLFIDMNLQIDATLQYAKGSKPSTPTWWPRVLPSDKYIDSPFNTYKNEGLPPAPIGSPSLEAILATLNPTDTECMFYFHDSKGEFHCTETYEEHVSLLKQYYGRGK